MKVTSTPTGAVSYRTTRLTVEVGQSLPRFRERYEHAVPPFPAAKVKELVQHKSPWQDMLDLMAATSPLGFFIFSRTMSSQPCGLPVIRPPALHI
jgi:hypothetical protein